MGIEFSERDQFIKQVEFMRDKLDAIKQELSRDIFDKNPQVQKIKRELDDVSKTITLGVAKLESTSENLNRISKKIGKYDNSSVRRFITNTLHAETAEVIEQARDTVDLLKDTFNDQVKLLDGLMNTGNKLVSEAKESLKVVNRQEATMDDEAKNTRQLR